MSEKVAVVTGSNKGIGLAIVEGLCQKYNGIVYLTARDVKRGEEAVAKLKAKGLNPRFHQLDVSDQASVDRFRDYLKQTHGGLDVLVNNAGIAIPSTNTDPLAVQVEETIKINYYGVLRVCDALFPLLRKNGKVVTLSSSVGFPKFIASRRIRAKFTDKNLTLEQLNNVVEEYLNIAKAGKCVEEGWGTIPYFISKVGVSALSIIQQKIFDKESPNRNISVNHVHPGYIDTDLTEHRGPNPVEYGASAPLFTILEANFKGVNIFWSTAICIHYVFLDIIMFGNGLSYFVGENYYEEIIGQFVWENCEVVDWYGEKVPPIKGQDLPFPPEVD